MGSCFSSSSSIVDSKPVARVISLDGALIEYSVPVSVSQMLGDDENSWSCFVSDADSLLFNSYIPPLSPQEWLQKEHIYFILPISMLDYPLTGLDMASLAVKASEALNNAARDKHGRRRSSRAIQVIPIDDFRECSQSEIDQKILPSVSLPMRRSSSSSKRAGRAHIKFILVRRNRDGDLPFDSLNPRSTWVRFEVRQVTKHPHIFLMNRHLSWDACPTLRTALRRLPRDFPCAGSFNVKGNALHGQQGGFKIFELGTMPRSGRFFIHQAHKQHHTDGDLWPSVGLIRL
ncbi:hypothetical protein J5N97_026128 [Dioscorea zingiberensis]|uniref:Uncharacterized protein n=1 Tax=Dioscorea zingiberensis TaxID=325984 RepID=A0A9D5C274_9LILI|nr:hypothetical protein J5N97_026128 [Dioscorea zingiberensis]